MAEGATYSAAVLFFRSTWALRHSQCGPEATKSVVKQHEKITSWVLHPIDLCRRCTRTGSTRWRFTFVIDVDLQYPEDLKSHGHDLGGADRRAPKGGGSFQGTEGRAVQPTSDQVRPG